MPAVIQQKIFIEQLLNAQAPVHTWGKAVNKCHYVPSLMNLTLLLDRKAKKASK